VAALLLLAAMAACDRDKTAAPSASASASASQRAAPLGLSAEASGKVLAKVGNRTITLGDYARAVERMDPFERLRYQSKERRQLLLDEMINLELLAQEAERRGLHQSPETEERLRQLLRDELLRELRAKVPDPAAIPEAEVRAYYEQHRAEFRDSERRRVAHIVMSGGPKAKTVLEQAKTATPAQWGQLVRQHSRDKPPPAEQAPAELAGDLGIVGSPGDPRGDNPRVPEPLRKAVFAIEALGGVYPELVEQGGDVHIVRLVGRTEARERSLAEAERAVRVALVQQRLERAEQELERELRQRFPVKLNDKALERVSVELNAGDGK
jgi:parvulin-like peptidyl-prolyl isomerase